MKTFLMSMIAAALFVISTAMAGDWSNALGTLGQFAKEYENAKNSIAQPTNEESEPALRSDGGMSQQEIASCSQDIKNKQIESQSWGGDVNAVANRLGRYQKDLFEGRCAGHPDAQGYIAGANKMLGYSSSTQTNSSKSELVNDCLAMSRNNNNTIQFTNRCNFTVQYSYCLTSVPDSPLFACKDAVRGEGEGSDGLRAGSTGILPESSHAEGVRWIACRGSIGEVLAIFNHDGKTGCY